MILYLCDDEPKMLSDMAAKVSALLPDARLQTFSSGQDLLSHMETEDCDILLLDIDMPELTGLEVAKELSVKRKKPLLVFVTSHDELVYDSFLYHPFAFLRKSRFDIEIGGILRDCAKELADKEQHFCFRTEGTEVRLLVSEIQYFEAEGNYLKVFTADGVYRFRSTLTAVEHTLANCGFIRIHKGFYVNQAAVKLFTSEAATLLNGAVLPLGKSYAKTAKEQLLRYMRA